MKLRLQPTAIKLPPVKDQLLFRGISIPIQIYLENRNGYRVSFTKRGANIRISRRYGKSEQQATIEKCKNWLTDVLKEKPQLAERYKTRKYESGTVIKTFDREFLIRISKQERKTIRYEINDQFLSFLIPGHVDESIVQEKHISRALAKYYRSFLEKRLSFWNQLFEKKAKKLRLKYNSSNWGSCSNKGNINLSTRLLLCPLPVIDYVIVHELAHLIHQNHSISFWKEVERVMPDYQIQAKWLKKNGSAIDF